MEVEERGITMFSFRASVNWLGSGRADRVILAPWARGWRMISKLDSFKSINRLFASLLIYGKSDPEVPFSFLSEAISRG